MCLGGRSCCGRYSRDSGVALPQYHVSTYHYQRPACREAHAEPRAARAAWRALYLCAASSALFRLMRGCRDQVHYGLCFPGASLRISLLFSPSDSLNHALGTQSAGNRPLRILRCGDGTRPERPPVVRPPRDPPCCCVAYGYRPRCGRRRLCSGLCGRRRACSGCPPPPPSQLVAAGCAGAAGGW